MRRQKAEEIARELRGPGGGPAREAGASLEDGFPARGAGPGLESRPPIQESRSPTQEPMLDEITPETVEQLSLRLDAHLVPEPSPGETRALIERLRPLVPQPRPRRFREEAMSREPVISFLHQLITQGRVLRPIWWLGSFALGLFALLLAPGFEQEGLPLAILAPLLVIGSVAYRFRALKGGALEIELSCPMTPAQMILSRVLVMTGYHLLLGGLLALLIPGPGGALLLSWTAALLLFTGLMLALTILLGGTGAATIASLAVWGLFVLLRDSWYSLFALPDALFWAGVQTGATLLGLALVGLALGSANLLRLLGRGYE